MRRPGKALALAALALSMALSPAAQSAAAPAPGVLAVTTTAGAAVELDAVQLAHAGTIIDVGTKAGANANGLAAALMAGLQESALRVLSNTSVPESAGYPSDGQGSDHDSVGIFQQRANWGTVAQRMDPAYSARAFFGVQPGAPAGMAQTPGWQTMAPGALAQAIQVSEYPDAYDRWLPAAQALLSMGLPPGDALAAVAAVPDYDTDPLVLAGLEKALAAARARSAGIAARVPGQQKAAAALAAAAAAAQAGTDSARAEAAAARGHLRSLVRAAYISSGAEQVSPALQALLSPASTSPEALMSGLELTLIVVSSQRSSLASAADRAAGADALARSGEARAAAALALLSKTRASAAAAAAEVARDQAAVAARIASVRRDLGRKTAAQAASATDAAGRWRAYLAQLAAAGITPPPAAALRDPAHLPAGLSAVAGRAGEATAATPGGPLLVLPREVVAAVGFAFAQLGKPYVWAAAGPAGFDCSGLMLAAYSAGGIPGLPRLSWDQAAWATPVAAGQEIAGDEVYFAGSDGTAAKPGHVGLVVDPARHLMVQAPQTGDVVKVSDYSGWPGLAGFGRVSTGGAR